MPHISAEDDLSAVDMTYHECHNAVCKQVSFTYGTGFSYLVASREFERKKRE
jgi:hypothetical protein